MRWAISTVKPLKSADPAGIAPVLLQQEVDHLTTHLYSLPNKRVYTQSLEAGQGDVYP